MFLWATDGLFSKRKVGGGTHLVARTELFMSLGPRLGARLPTRQLALDVNQALELSVAFSNFRLLETYSFAAINERLACTYSIIRV